MSTKAVVAMFEKAENDEALREALHTALAEAGDAGREAFLRVAADHGFHFSAEELTAAAMEISAPPEGELDEQQLQGVVGGAAAGKRALPLTALRKFAPPIALSGMYCATSR